MLHRDYLMRLIERAIRFLQLVTGQIELKQYPEALKLIAQGYEQFFGLDPDTLHALPLEYLLSTLKLDGELDSDRCLLLAALMESEGEVWAAQGDEARAVHRFLRALRLRLAAFEQAVDPAWPQRWVEVEALAERLARYEVPPETGAALVRYYEAAGQFARAEDWLWRGVGEQGATAGWVAQGSEFYQRLLALDDGALAAGGLPRAEVARGLRELGSLGEEPR